MVDLAIFYVFNLQLLFFVLNPISAVVFVTPIHAGGLAKLTAPIALI